MAERVIVGLIDGHKVSAVREYPEDMDDFNGLMEIPSEDLCDIICDAIVALVPESETIEAAGVALPGIVHNGVVEDSPNLRSSRAPRSATGSRRRSRSGAGTTTWMSSTTRMRSRPGSPRSRVKWIA